MLFLFLILNNCYSQENNWINYISGGRQIYSIVEDESFMWVGTDIGLVRVNKYDHQIKLYDKTTGLPYNGISSLLFDLNKNLWIGTGDMSGGCGLVKFDGSNFEVFNTDNSGLYSNRIQSLEIDGKNNIWIGNGGSYKTDYGCLTKYDGNAWTTYNAQNSTLTDTYVHFIKEIDSTLWIGTEGGIITYNGLDWNYLKPRAYHYNCIAIDSSNNLWIGQAIGLLKFDGTAWTEYDSSLVGRQEVLSLEVDKSNNLWIGTHYGLIKYDGVNWTKLNTDNSGLPAQQVTTIKADNSNNKWIGTFDWNNNGGLSKYDENSWTKIQTSICNLPSNYIYSIKKDKQNNIWIGANAGLVKVSNNKWEIYLCDSSSIYGAYTYDNIAFDESNNIWGSILGFWPMGFPPEGGVFCYNSSDWTYYNTQNSALPYNKINAIAIDNLNNKWVGTDYGLTKLNNNVWQIYNTDNSEIASNNINDIAIEGDKIWIGTNDDGLTLYNGNDWITFDTTNSPIPDNSVFYIEQDKNGFLWICTKGGLVKYDGMNWSVYKDIFTGYNNNWISSICIDNNNVKWIASCFNGFARFDDSTWTIYNTENSWLLSDRITDITCDKDNNIWIAHEGEGISVFNENGILSDVKEHNNKMIITDFSLSQNFPNPFNPTTKIKYSIPVETGHAPSLHTVLKVYDILGNEVATLVNEEKPAGEYEVEMDGSKLTSGIYFYQLSTSGGAGSFIETKKLMLLK